MHHGDSIIPGFDMSDASGASDNRAIAPPPPPQQHTPLSLYNLWLGFSCYNTGYSVIDYHLIYVCRFMRLPTGVAQNPNWRREQICERYHGCTPPRPPSLVQLIW